MKERFLDSAFAYLDTKLWEKIEDGAFFAVEHFNGEIGYCLPMGKANQMIALCDYIGEAGLASYSQQLVDRKKLNSFEMNEMMFSQDCLSINYAPSDVLRPEETEAINLYLKNKSFSPDSQKLPHLLSFKPFTYPWAMKESSERFLKEALDAAISLEKKVSSGEITLQTKLFDSTIPLYKKDKSWGVISVSKEVKLSYQIVTLTKPQLASLQKQKRSLNSWSAEVFMHPQPMVHAGEINESNPADAPFFPCVLLIVNEETGSIMAMQAANNYSNYKMDFRNAIIKAIKENGIPSAINVKNPRVYSVFAKIATDLNIELKLQLRSEMLEAALQSYWNHFTDSQNDTHECGCGHHHEDGHECSCGHHHEDGHECCGGHHHEDGHECGCGHHHEDGHECCGGHHHKDGHTCGCGHHHDEPDMPTEEEYQQFLAMLRDKEALKTVPDDLLMLLDQMTCDGEVEKEIYANIQEEIVRRGLR